jgi:predicted DNA-binding transcriptional regulator AlpA
VNANGTGNAPQGSRGAPLTLTTLLAEPAAVDALDLDALAQLLEECASERERLEVVERRARARLCRDLALRVRGEDRLLKIDEAAARLGVTEDWIRRRPQLPFRVPLSEGVVRYSVTGIARFIAQRQGA